MTEHTKEPWRIRDGIYPEVPQPITSGDGSGTIASVGGYRRATLKKRAADARRIVACVNACAGIPTEALEGGAVAEVSTSLRELLDWCRDNTSPRDTNSPHQLLLTAVRALHNLRP